MDNYEIGDEHLAEGRLKLHRDPFGRCVMRVVSERRGTEHDFFSDEDLVIRAVRLLIKAATSSERQAILATINRDLYVLGGYLLKREIVDIRSDINRFFSRVKVAMRNCAPLLPESEAFLPEIQNPPSKQTDL